MIVRTNKEGELYVYRKVQFTRGKGSSNLKASIRNTFLIKAGTNSCNILVGQISFPISWLGKKIRLKVEVIL